MSWTLQCGQGTWQIDDRRALEQELSRLHLELKHDPAVAHLIAPDGACLNIALGSDLSVLNFIAPGGWPAQHSVGDDSAEELVRFKVASDISEFPGRCAIPIAVAIDAALVYYSTGKLTDKVHWEKD